MKIRKITCSDGKRRKVPTFLPKGRAPKGGWSKSVLSKALQQQERWIARNQSAAGKKVSEGMKKSWARRSKFCPAPITSPKKTKLSFLEYIQTRKQNGWNIENATKFVETIQTKMVDETYGGFRFDVKLASKETGMSPSSCQFFLQELKKANKEGYSLEEYFRLGRPFRPGKKVLAE